MSVTDNPRVDHAAEDVEALIPEARELTRRRRRRRGAATVLLAALLAGGGFAIWGGGGGTGAPPAGTALHGPLPAGIAARAADPSGGAIGWGIRIVHSTGYTCVQLGRLRGRQLGLIAEDGLAGDSGRFIAMAPSTAYQARCAPDDGDGHAFMTNALGAQPVSGAGGGYTGESMCQSAAQVAAQRQMARRLHQPALLGGSGARPICPAGDVRYIQYGLLGPDAESITYRTTGGPVTEQTGADGSYLVVGPATPAFCRRFPQGTCGLSGASSTAGLGSGMIETVTYRDGSTCRLPASGPVTFAEQCPKVGYVPAAPGLTATQVTAPVHVRVVHAPAFCLRPGPGDARTGFGAQPATELGPYVPCAHASSTRPGAVQHGAIIVFSWTARRAVSSPRSNYTYMVADGRCGSQGGSTYGRIRAGERLTQAMIEDPRPGCSHAITVTVGFNPNLGPGQDQSDNDDPGRGSDLLVGRRTVTLPR